MQELTNVWKGDYRVFHVHDGLIARCVHEVVTDTRCLHKRWVGRSEKPVKVIRLWLPVGPKNSEPIWPSGKALGW